MHETLKTFGGVLTMKALTIFLGMLCTAIFIMLLPTCLDDPSAVKIIGATTSATLAVIYCQCHV